MRKSYTKEQLEQMSPEELLNVAKENLINLATLNTQKIIIEYDKYGYNGKFILRYPTLLDTLNIGVLKAKMIEQLKSVDNLTDNIAYMYSTLITTAIEYPSWFDLNKMTEIKVLEDVYTEFEAQVSAIRTNNLSESY